MLIHQDKSNQIFFREFLDESEKLQSVVAAGNEHHWAFSELATDLFTMMYESHPKKVEGEIPLGLQVAKQAIDQIAELTEYKELHILTQMDPFTSGLATQSLAQNLMKMLPKVGPKSEEDLHNEAAVCVEAGLTDALERTDKAIEKLGKIQAAASKVAVNPDELRQKMRVILGEAIKATEEGGEASTAFGFDDSFGTSKPGNLKEKMALAKRVGQSAKLKEIAELSGRFCRIAKKKQMEKSTESEINSIKTGNDLGRLLPSELAKLGNPLTRGMFYKGFVEKTLLEYELENKTPKGKGPIICCIDSSGSMAGTPECAGKGIAMALLGIARKQKRDFVLIQFGSSHQLRVFQAPLGKTEQMPLLVELEFFWNGGTSFKESLDASIGFIKQAKFNAADIVFVTDGLCDIPVEFEVEYKKTKKERGFGCIGVLIGSHENMIIMNKFCDTVFNVADLLSDDKNDSVHESIFKI